MSLKQHPCTQLLKFFLPTAYLEFLSEEEGDDGGETGEKRGQEHAHIADLNRDVKEVHNVVNGRRRYHQA
jgi:hypothetical protein